jgi:hypothetical protein
MTRIADEGDASEAVHRAQSARAFASQTSGKRRNLPMG